MSVIPALFLSCVSLLLHSRCGSIHAWGDWQTSNCAILLQCLGTEGQTLSDTFAEVATHFEARQSFGCGMKQGYTETDYYVVSLCRFGANEAKTIAS